MSTSEYATNSTIAAEPGGTPHVTASPTYRAFDFRFTLDGAAAAVAADVMGCMRADVRSTSPTRVVLETDAPNEHVLHLDGESEFRTDDLGKLVHQTMWEVTRRGVDSRSDALVIHAASVVLHDRVVLISGRSGSGKSTLAAALLDLGAEYLTDEAVEIDATGRPVDWLVRPLKLDEDALATLDDAGGLGFTGTDGFARSSGLLLPDGTLHVPVPRGRLFDRRPTDGTMVVFLESQAGPLRPEPAPRSTAVARLIGESFVPGSRRQSGLEAAALLTDGPRLLTMSGGSVDQRAEWIDAALR
jgi:hypothetical protein